MKKTIKKMSAILAAVLLGSTLLNTPLQAEEKTLQDVYTETIEQVEEKEALATYDAETPSLSDADIALLPEINAALDSLFDDAIGDVRENVTQEEIDAVNAKINELESPELKELFLSVTNLIAERFIVRETTVAVDSLYDEAGNLILPVDATTVETIINNLNSLSSGAFSIYEDEINYIVEKLDPATTELLIQSIVTEAEAEGYKIVLNTDLMLYFKGKNKTLTVDEVNALFGGTVDADAVADAFEVSFGTYDPTMPETAQVFYNVNASTLKAEPGTYDITFSYDRIERGIVSGPSLNLTLALTVVANPTTTPTTPPAENTNSNSGTLPKTGENVSETVVIGSGLTLLGAIAFVLRRKMA